MINSSKNIIALTDIDVWLCVIYIITRKFEKVYKYKREREMCVCLCVCICNLKLSCMTFMCSVTKWLVATYLYLHRGMVVI